MVWIYNNNMYIRLMNYAKTNTTTNNIKDIRAVHPRLSLCYAQNSTIINLSIYVDKISY